MENLCWNCGSATHHRKECPSPPNPELRKDIKKAYDKTSGKGNYERQFISHLSKQIKALEILSDAHLPPLTELDKEVERLDNYWHEKLIFFEDLPQKVGADSATSQLEVITHLRKELDEERPNVWFVNTMRKSYDLPNKDSLSQSGILNFKIQNLSEKQRTLSEKVFNLQSKIKCGIRVEEEFVLTAAELVEFLNDATAAFDSGRPLTISEVTNQWLTKKEKLRSLDTVLAKYEYLFDEITMSNFKEQLEMLKLSWRTAKEMKVLYESEMPKIFCKICCSKEVEYLLPNCGHVFCEQCLRQIRRCALCRGSVRGAIKIHF